MNKEKYYIPKLEEFYPGFEYEELNSNKSINGAIQEYVSTIYKQGKILLLGSRGLTEVSSINYRVKYLDKEDIEDLGFTLIHREIKDDMYKSDFCKFKKDKVELTIQFENVNNQYPNPCNFRGSNFHFSATIKNKSELKRILKQIGVL